MPDIPAKTEALAVTGDNGDRFRHGRREIGTNCLSEKAEGSWEGDHPMCKEDEGSESEAGAERARQYCTNGMQCMHLINLFSRIISYHVCDLPAIMFAYVKKCLRCLMFSVALLDLCLKFRVVLLDLQATSASFLADLSVRSPRKLFIFIIYKNIFWIKVSNKYYI